MTKKNEKIPFGIFLNFLLCCMSYFIPKKDYLFLIGSREGNFFADNPKYLYLYANKIKDKNKFVWMTKIKKLLTN